MNATFFTNSYNRLPLIKNLLRSFELCNRSTAVEWVVTDYGSTDGSREWLSQYAKSLTVPMRLHFEDEQEYFQKLRVGNVDRRARREAILRKFRNDSRRLARGKYIFDIGSDHQFIRPADLVAEVEAVFRHRQSVTGQADLSGVIVFGYFRWRLDKPNNRRGAEQNSDAVPYYVAEEKAYVDYSVMRRREVDKLGPFVELAEVVPGSSLMGWWQAGSHLEMEYMDRCAQQGLHRAFLKYPQLLSFRNHEAAELVSQPASQDSELIVSLWTIEEMEKKFGWLGRPISSEELDRSLSPSILERSQSIFSRWTR